MTLQTQLLYVVLMLTWSTISGQPDSSEFQLVKNGLQQNKRINVLGTNRNYHLFVPNQPKNAPIVVLFHGNRGSHTKLLGLKRGNAPYKIWLDLAKQENIIIAIPNGVRGPKRHRGWNDCRSDAKSNPSVDDVLFIKSLINSIVTTYRADASKVFAVGTSNGGHMSMRLAQEIPNKLKAVASIAASSPVNSKCTNATVPLSVLIMNGTKDPIMPYLGGQMPSDRGKVYSTKETIDYWIKRNQTDTTPKITEFPDSNSKDKSTVKKFLYRNGQNNTAVAFYKVIGGGHNEPSKSQRYRRIIKRFIGEQNGDIEMANEVWNFFKNQSK